MRGYCTCAVGYERKLCKKYEAGLVFFSGKHRTRTQVLKYILAQPCWRGAVVTVKKGARIVTLGTARMRLYFPDGLEDILD